MAEYKIIVLGMPRVGKTALTLRFVTNHFVEDSDPTLEDSYRKQVSIDDEPCLLDILDTAGQEEYAAMRDRYLRCGEGFVLVYDIANRPSLEEATDHYRSVVRIKDDDKVPCVLVGHKCDLEGERQIPREEGQALADSWGPNAVFVESSAKEDINCEEVFFSAVRLIRARWREPKNPPKARKPCSVQ